MAERRLVLGVAWNTLLRWPGFWGGGGGILSTTPGEREREGGREKNRLQKHTWPLGVVGLRI